MFSLGIEIKPELLARQVGWFAPTHQPFLVPKKRLNSIGLAPASGELQAEVRDTFEIYNVPDDLDCVLVGEEEFNYLAHTARAELVRSQVRLKAGSHPLRSKCPGRRACPGVNAGCRASLRVVALLAGGTP